MSVVIVLSIVIGILTSGCAVRELEDITVIKDLIMVEETQYHDYEEICFNNTVYNFISKPEEDAAIFKNKKYGYINASGEVIIPEEYDEARSFNDGFAIVKKDNKYGVIDNQNNIILPFNYDALENYGNARFLTKKDDKYGLVKETGNIAVIFDYDVIDNKYSDYVPNNKKIKNYYIAKKGSFWGVIDKDGNILLPFEYDEICGADEKTVIVKKEEKFAVIKTDGTVIYPFDSLPYTSVGGGYLFRGSIFKHVDLCDTNGKIIKENTEYIPMIYVDDNMLISIKGDKKGAVDINGNITLDFEYDELKVLDENYLYFEKKGKKGLIKNLKEIILDFDFSGYPYMDEKGYIYAVNRDRTRVNIIYPNGTVKESYEGVNFGLGNNFMIIQMKDDRYALIKTTK